IGTDCGVPLGRPLDHAMRNWLTVLLLIWLSGLKRCWSKVRFMCSQSAGSGLANVASVTGRNSAVCADACVASALRIAAAMQDVALIMIASLIVLFVRLCWADMDSKLDQKRMAGTSPAVPSIQLSIRKLRQLREMAKQSSPKWSIAVDRYRQTPHHKCGGCRRPAKSFQACRRIRR